MTANYIFVLKRMKNPPPQSLDALLDMFLKYLDSFYKKYNKTLCFTQIKQTKISSVFGSTVFNLIPCKHLNNNLFKVYCNYYF